MAGIIAFKSLPPSLGGKKQMKHVWGTFEVEESESGVRFSKFRWQWCFAMKKFSIVGIGLGKPRIIPVPCRWVKNILIRFNGMTRNTLELVVLRFFRMQFTKFQSHAGDYLTRRSSRIRSIIGLVCSLLPICIVPFHQTLTLWMASHSQREVVFVVIFSSSRAAPTLLTERLYDWKHTDVRKSVGDIQRRRDYKIIQFLTYSQVRAGFIEPTMMGMFRRHPFGRIDIRDCSVDGPLQKVYYVQAILQWLACTRHQPCPTHVSVLLHLHSP